MEDFDLFLIEDKSGVDNMCYDFCNCEFWFINVYMYLTCQRMYWPYLESNDITLY